MCVLSRVQLFAALDCNLPGSSVHGILQAKILKWVAISYSMGSSWPRDRTYVSCISYIGRELAGRDNWNIINRAISIQITEKFSPKLRKPEEIDTIFSSGERHVLSSMDSVSTEIHLKNEEETEALRWISVQFSPSVVSDSLRPHELQHARICCPSLWWIGPILENVQCSLEKNMRYTALGWNIL